MKAVQFSAYGGPEVLRVVEVDEPHAGPGQARIAVRAAGVNLSDLMKVRAGRWKGKPIPLPSGVGVEGAGIVDEVGAGVTDIAIGDAVFGCGFDMVAQYAVLRPGVWARKPDDLSFEEAAGFSVAVETATRILAQVGVKSGETLLVSGASGGIGSAAIQFARHRGITVIGTASAPNHEYLRGLGAIPTTYGPGLVQRVRKLAPNGVDAALDIAGSSVIPELLEAAPAARVVNLSSGAYLQIEAGADFPEQVRAPAHSLSKYTLNVLTATLASAFRGTGVLINAVDPGRVATHPERGDDADDRPASESARWVVWAATLPAGGPTGGVFLDGERLA